MRRLSAALTFTFLLFFSAVAQEKSDREKSNLLGPVRSVRLETVEYKDETLKQSVGTWEVSSVTYDEKGNELERFSSLQGTFTGKEVRTYDAKGNLIAVVVSNEEGVHERRVYAYEGGKLISIVSYDADGKVDSKQFNSYGKDGLLLEEKYFIGGKIFGKTLFKYDSVGNLSEVAFYAPNGAKALALIGPCRGAHRVTYAYNEQRQPIKKSSYETNGELKYRWQYSYDSKGLVTSESNEYLSAPKQTSVYAYEYDSRGNWIKKIATTDFGPKVPGQLAPRSTASVTSREISYY
jgi:hypothetical protein